MVAFAYHGLSSFGPHLAVFAGLITLGFGYWICLQARQDPKCPKWGKFLGILISVVAALGLLCIGYLTIKKCCRSQYGKDWHKTHMQMMMTPDAGEPAKEGK
ncbi:MAG: hypothetical protein HY609_03310 [Deltaproteobacteria bacterium]|nr:hypothetical protein [Deltaproteobacteria bacterium]MBI4223938.1 hypothetical protein [Deltaproteobacteria bacterium]